MAEVKIEKKTPIWPYIILIAVVIAVLLYIFYSNDDNTGNRHDERFEESPDGVRGTGQMTPEGETVSEIELLVLDYDGDKSFDKKFDLPFEKINFNTPQA